MKKTPIIFSLLLFAGGINLLEAQQYKIEVPPVIPPSPNAAALGKYGNFPVGLNTGIPEINIPLYTIMTSRLEVPISLSYHASGNKVSEFASWIGLGWSLNAGGVISRSVVGLPDDESGFLFDSNIKNASQLTNNNYDYLSSIANNMIDGESDYYYYNFIGKAGAFIFSQNSHIPFLIPKVPIRINYNFTLNQFEITDEMGVKYKFHSKEYLNYWLNENLRDYVSSYYLSEIVSADGTDHIYFTYEQDGGYAENNKVFTEVIGQSCDYPPTITNDYHFTNWVNQSRSFDPIVLKEINFTCGKIEFIKDITRLDAPKSRLDEIRISERNADGTFTIIKKITLGEGYFVTPPGNTTDLNRLKLSDVTEKDAQGIAVKKYSFLYNEATMLPDRTSLAQDWWGFYNGQWTNTSLIASESIYFFSQFQVGSANRAPNETSMQACILKTIIYPTGGYTEFVYEPHYYGSGIMAGGLRIKEISNYEITGKVPVTKIYKYGTGESGSGELLIPPEGLGNSKQEINYEPWVPAGSFCIPVTSFKRIHLDGRTPYDLTSLNGASVAYREVTIYENNSATKPNGKKVYRFSVYPDIFQGVDRAYKNGRYQINETWKGGDEIYNAALIGNTTRKSEANFNSYSFLSNLYTIGTKVGWKIVRVGCPMPTNDIKISFYYFDYPIYSGIKKLTSTTKRQYSSANSDSIDIKNSYYYENLADQHQQLTKATIVNSKGETVMTKYWYPLDYDTTTVTQSLVRKNIVAVPIKEEIYINDNIIGGKVTQYNNYGHPKEIDLYETNIPQSPPAHNPVQLVPAGYAKRLEMTYYTNQNLQSISKENDINVSYIWGYNSVYPIIKAENVSSTTLQSAVNNSLPSGFYSLEQLLTSANGIKNLLTDIQKNLWKTFCSNLHGQSTLSGAMISLFTYEPQVGMTSETNINGIMKFYEYDSFGRLSVIKDHDGRILKIYEYHYKQ